MKYGTIMNKLKNFQKIKTKTVQHNSSTLCIDKWKQHNHHVRVGGEGEMK